VDVAEVRRYYDGRADVTSFAVADRALEGRTAEALELLRHAMTSGVAPVLVTSALASSLRALVTVGSAPRGLSAADLARHAQLPPWKVDVVRRQLRGWTGDGLSVAIRAVATADADVKGAASDPGYALERAVVAVSSARAG
jgi:DNA polymerase-3 subunit delta